MHMIVPYDSFHMIVGFDAIKVQWSAQSISVKFFMYLNDQAAIVAES